MLRVMLAALLVIGGATMQASAEPEVAELGTPVKGVNWVQLFAGEDAGGEPRVYIKMGQQAKNLFVLRVDPVTGAYSQYLAPGENSQYPTAACWAHDGRLYIGAAYSGRLLRFDPRRGRIEDLGAIDPPEGTFPCRIDESPDGSLFRRLLRQRRAHPLRPKTGEFRRYGRCDPTDMYCYPLVAHDGVVACLIRMTTPHVVLVDPGRERRKRSAPASRPASRGPH